MTTALLLSAAVALLLLRPPVESRLTRLVPRQAPESSPLRSPPPLAVFAVIGALAWWLIGGMPGLVVGGLLAVGGPKLASYLDAARDRDDDVIALQLPLALDLVGACLLGGCPLADALTSVARAVEGPVGARLLRVAAAMRVGTPADEAFLELGTHGAAGAAARALRRAADGGAPVAAAISRVAEESRRTATSVARRRVKQAGVKAAAPLTVCFLPAFLLLGTVPVVIAVAGPLMRAL